MASEIERAAGISRAGINFALRRLVKEKLVIKEGKTSSYRYSADYSNPVIKQLKALKTTVLLQPTLNRLKKVSGRIILFGSCARGEDTDKSDIDLFILTNASRAAIEEKIEKSALKKRLQLVVRNATQFVKMQKNEPVFFAEIDRGITLWESKDEPGI